MEPRNVVVRAPGIAVSRVLAVSLVVLWGVLRLWLFGNFVFPLTYVLPLFLGVWTRDAASVWGMSAVFMGMQLVHQAWILPSGVLSSAEEIATLGATAVNIVVGASAVHAIILLRGSLERQVDEIRGQADELQAQAEEIAQQKEEVTEQAEELTGQNEELQRQSEEIQELCEDLERREGLVQRLVATAMAAGPDASALERTIGSALAMFGAQASALIVYERTADGLMVRAASSKSNLPIPTAPQPAHSFVELTIAQNRTASLNDAALRPDLALPGLGGTEFRSVLCVPVHEPDGTPGAIAICAEEPYAWAQEHFRLAEWLATQCWNVLRLLRAHAQQTRQAALIDLAPTAILVRQPDGEITFWSRGAEALYGWTAADAVGRNIHELLRTSFPRPLDDIEGELRQAGEWTGEVVQVARSGRTVSVESHWRTDQQSPGIPGAVLEANVDVTIRRRAEDGLREADRRKNEFIATLSHELRNPLAPIRFAVGLLEQVQDPAAERPRRVIERQLRHLVRLIDDLLDVTRIANNKIQLQITRIDMTVLIEQVLDAVRPELDRHGHTSTFHAPRERFWADGDHERLTQVLTNLLNNAARYTPQGGSIEVSVASTGGMIEVAVRDNGIGLRSDDLARVFEMFTQVGNPGSGGLGIGLALVKGVMELHGGSVEARSDGAGHGCTFVFRLPAAQRPVEPAVPAMNQVLQRAVPRRILVVDDNVDNAAMMEAILAVDGHSVQVAHDGRSGLAALDQFSPDVAFLDVGLPDMSGYDLARQLRDHPAGASTVLVAVTGWGQDSDYQRARDAGFALHLPKPADPARIRDIAAGGIAHPSTGTP